MNIWYFSFRHSCPLYHGIAPYNIPTHTHLTTYRNAWNLYFNKLCRS